MRVSQQQLDAILKKEGYRAVGERGPDKQKRKVGSGFRKTYPDYNRMLIVQIELAKLPAPTAEHVFHPTRRWRLDLSYPARRLAIEVDGAVHRIKGMFYRDMEKHQALFFEGWRLLRVSTAEVRNGEALRMVERALELYGEP